MSQKKRISLLLIAAASFSLIGCTSSSPEPTKAPEPYGLNNEIPTTNIPEWNLSNFAFPENWEQPSDDGSTFATLGPNTVYSKQTETSCSFLATISYLPQKSKGEGSEFLTKKYIYEIAKSEKVPELTETTIESDGGPINFYLTENTVIPDPLTQEPLNGVFAARVFSPTKNGTPVADILYACTDEKDYNTDEQKKLFKDLTLSIK